jgi:hypothetical protein
MLEALPKAPITDEEHLTMLKRAIAANLDARIKHDIALAKQQKGVSDGDIQSFCGADIMAADSDWLYLDDLIANPIRKALRAQLKDLGWRLFRLTKSIETMRDVCLEAANKKLGGFQARADIVDKAWNGIGDDHDRWWC